MDYQVTIITDADVNEIVDIYKDAGWWDDNFGTSFIDTMLKSSFRFAGAFYNGQLIGMGRVLSDGISDAYIQDIAVLKKYRGNGIGKAIVSKLVSELRRCDIDWIGLIGEPGTAEFYENLGFKTMTNYIPMKYDA